MVQLRPVGRPCLVKRNIFRLPVDNAAIGKQNPYPFAAGKAQGHAVKADEFAALGAEFIMDQTGFRKVHGLMITPFS